MSIMLIKLIVNFVLITLLINYCKACSSGEYPFEKYLAVRTPYRLVGNKTFGQIQYEGCEAKKIWMIVRHGTRNPSSNTISLMKEKLTQIKDLILDSEQLPNEYIRPRDLDLFRKWKIKLNEKDGEKLVHEGEDENLLLAERMQSRFPHLFKNIYTNSSYNFKFTHSQRTKKSCLQFVAGLFGRQTLKSVWFPEPLKNDPILRFYKNCDKWTTDVKKNATAMQEYTNFLRGVQILRSKNNVSKRLGLEGKLTTEDVLLMYQACGFETAWNKVTKSPWCSVFTENELKVLEYAEDLKYYWQDGYGHSLSYDQACPAFKDMITFLENSEEHKKASVYFTHSGTILKIIAHIGIYKDKTHLTVNNFDKMVNYRKWRTGLIDAFASNLAFVLFRCGNNDKILTMHQENIVRLPCCQISDLCDIVKIKNFYAKSINNCNFDELCGLNPDDSSDSISES